MKAWIARDKDGETFLYSSKPERKYEFWFSSDYCFPIIELSEGVNPQWEDAEPIEVEISIAKASADVVTIPKNRYEQLLQYEQEYISRQSMINSFMQNK